MKRAVIVLGLVSAVAGCDDGDGATEPEQDAVVQDAARPDMATPDVATPDAGDLDAGPDSAPADAAPADAAVDAEPGPDARPPQRPDILPLPGPADLPGADDLTAPVPAGQARAGRIDDPAEAPTGSEARCGEGSFRLDNARISACVEGVATFSQITSTGGGLVDVGWAGQPGSDRFTQWVIAPGMGEVVVDTVGIVADGADGGPAVVQVVGRADGGRLIQGYLAGSLVPAPVKVITEYVLAPDATEIEVRTWLEGDEAQGAFLMADMVLFGDLTDAFVPGAPVDGALPRVTPFLAASAEGIAYGYRNLEGSVSAYNIPIDSFPLTPVNLGQATVRLGDLVLYRRALGVGPDVESLRPADVEAVNVTVRGPAGAQVSIDDTEKLITRLVIGEEGTRVVRLRAGSYRASTVGWAGGDTAPAPFEVGAEGGEVVVEPAQAGQLNVTVEDQHGRRLGAKLWIEPVGGGERRIEFVVDQRAIALPAGEWRVITSRGWHYGVDDRPVTIEPGVAVDHAVVLDEVIPFEGWTAGEFHQHATPSTDSDTPLDRIVLMNLGDGVGFMVPSDHDILHDYAGHVRSMGLADRITVPLTGVEISPLVAHIGAYGLPLDRTMAAGGVPALSVKEDGRWRKRRIPELVREARDLGAQVVQLNHPRASQGLFDEVGYAADVDVATLEGHPEWTLDFDTVEVFNDSEAFCDVLDDWLGLLNQGRRLTAVGNSDTHGVRDPAGYPRNYLRTAAEVPQGVTGEEVSAALRTGAVTVSGGAVADLPDGPLPGSVVRVDGDTYTVRVRVRTPPWAKADRLIALHNGRPVVDRALETVDADIVDLDAEVEVPVDADGPLVFLVVGTPNLPYVRQGAPLFALINPLWLDRDGDGDVTPIGPGPVDLPDTPLCR